MRDVAIGDNKRACRIAGQRLGHVSPVHEAESEVTALSPDSESSDYELVPGPLAGIRVIDMGVWHAGPGAAAILGDLGADVVKVEPLQGDPERHHGGFAQLEDAELVGDPSTPPDWNILFELSNRNKRGLALDVTAPGDRQVLDALVDRADVFITNLRPTTRQHLSADYVSLAARNPRLVYVAVSAFGPRGPMAGRGGFDTMGQAVSGMMFLTGSAEPRPLSMIILDQLTAIAASHAALAALVARGVTSRGQEIETSMYGAATWFQHANLLTTAVMKDPVNLAWDRRRASPLRTTYRCGDDRWIVGTNHPPEKFWPALCRALDRQDLLGDPRFDTKEKRSAGNGELIDVLDGEFAKRSRDEWLAITASAGLLFAPVNSMADTLSDEQAWANQYWANFRHPFLGEIRVPGYPASFSDGAAGLRSPAPGLGEHNDEIRNELGLSATQAGAGPADA